MRGVKDGGGRVEEEKVEVDKVEGEKVELGESENKHRNEVSHTVRE